MFYSQFILAKKGPLGTIWIAAHLERKLRKNQVADTDIGDSVDSILSPDVPIALRLSSHLLLGVVRIYSRKVNYLFDDCSEALLKIKQAFRSAAVDLPPEQSKAPYHSITMPETFDLDDFELPDNDILQGNFVDHHISSREQITLQDTMEGVSYSTSKFGLDERFGDGDTSLLDLDEDLLLEDSRVSESANHGDVGPSIAFIKQDELSETAYMSSETMVNRLDNLFDYAQAPSTPGLVEEPNLPKTSASGSDEHLESEYHLMECTVAQNANESANGHKHEADWCSRDLLNPDLAPDVLNDENAFNAKAHREGVKTSVEDTAFEFKIINEPSSEADAPPENQIMEEFEKKASDEDKNNSLSDSHFDEKNNLGKSGHESHDVEIAMNKPNDGTNELPSHNVETEGYLRDIVECNVREMEDSTGTPVVGPSNTTNGHSGQRMPDCDAYLDVYAQFDAAVLKSSGKEDPAKLAEVSSLSETSKSIVGENHAELLEPEKLMSASEGNLVNIRHVPIDGSPAELVGFVEADDGSKVITGKKRSFTESTLTEQSLNATESSRLVRCKQMSVPDDDDLLSSILVGRSSALKVKTTPRLFEVTSEKRTHAALRSGAFKRKVLMDDTMVLHGDMIRQQLVDTEDIHRVRKKAPCSCAEISMIQRQYLEDEIFLEPVFSGVSNDLASLHRHPFDLSGIKVCKSDQDGASMTVADGQNRLSLDNHIKQDESSEFAAAVYASSQDAENIRMLEVEDSDSCRRLDIAEQRKECDTIDPSLERTEPDDACENDTSNKETMETANILVAPLLDTTAGIVTSQRNEDDGASSSFVIDALSGQAINDDDLEGKGSDINVNVEPKDIGEDGHLQGGDQDFEHTQTISRHGDNYDTQSMTPGDLLGDQDPFLYAGNIDHKEVFNDVDGNQELSGSHLYDMVSAEDLMQYQHDQDEMGVSAQIDTEFLNLGDDEEEEDEQEGDAKESLPEDEDARFAENTGWSSRTRAVSKYLRTLFIKEAECGRNCVSMENLLSGKSRKEASRMFFETLVLKTRDHIHVEQPNPCGNITIKPRTRLMKSHF